jgi:hypothetical protein
MAEAASKEKVKDEALTFKPQLYSNPYKAKSVIKKQLEHSKATKAVAAEDSEQAANQSPLDAFHSS